MILKNFVLILAFCFLAYGQALFAQSKNENTSVPKAELIQSSPYVGSEQESAYIDILRSAMQSSPNSKAIFVFYCGKTCGYGEIEAHIRGLNISLKGKGWKNSEFAVVQGGYRDKFTLEYWMVPEKVGLPIPNSTIDIKDVIFKSNFKRKFFAYDCC